MAERDHENYPEPDSEHEGPDAGELTPGNAQEGFSEEATSVLHFDPFESGMDGDSSESETSGDGSDGYAGEEQPGEQGDGQAQAPAEGSDQGAAAEQGQEETELQRLQRELYERDQLLAQYTQQGQGQDQGQGQAQGQAQGQPQGQAQGQDQAQPQIPNYAFRIPDEMWEQIESDDPNERRQGIGQLLQGVAQAVHQQVQSEYQQQLQTLRQQELPQTIQQTVQQREQQREVYQDFYGNYPDLNHPELRSVVQNAGQQEASLRQARGESVQWSPDFRDAVAQRVYAILGRTPPQQGQASAQGQAQRQPQRSPRGQPANLGRGSAPRAAPQGEAASQQHDVIDTLFG